MAWCFARLSRFSRRIAFARPVSGHRCGEYSGERGGEPSAAGGCTHAGGAGGGGGGGGTFLLGGGGLPEDEMDEIESVWRGRRGGYHGSETKEEAGDDGCELRRLPPCGVGVPGEAGEAGA